MEKNTSEKKKIANISEEIKNNIEVNIINISKIIDTLELKKDFNKEIKQLKEIEKSFFNNFGIKLSEKEKNLIKKYVK